MENPLEHCPTKAEYCNSYCSEFNAPCTIVHKAFYLGGVIFVSNYISLDAFENILEKPEIVKEFREYQSQKWMFNVFLRSNNQTTWKSFELDELFEQPENTKLEYYKLYKTANDMQKVFKLIVDESPNIGIIVENDNTEYDTASEIDNLQTKLIRYLKTMPYDEYLKTRHWKKLKQQKLQESGNKCQMCGSRTQLELHHNTYENRGEEKPEDLIIICKKCHSKHHNK